MIDFEKLFDGLAVELKGQLKRLPGSSEIKIFCGINRQGGLRISFMSPIAPPKIDSTKGLKVSCQQESDKVFWISFDLVNINAKPVFFALCDDLLNVIENNRKAEDALQSLKNRFYAWQSLFQHETASLSEEQVVGLMGELFFIKNYAIPRYGTDIAIDSWSGPEGASKDFSTEDTWFEIKAVSLSSNAVKINSIPQLSSPVPGNLVILRYEIMSDQFDDKESNLLLLFRNIMGQIKNDDTKSHFVSKLLTYGFDITGASYHKKYRIDSMTFYKVGDDFPRLIESDIKYPEIDKIVYTLLINSLERFKDTEAQNAKY